MDNKKLLLAIFLIVAATIIVYLPGLNGPFVFDDHVNIELNKFLRIQNLNSSELYLAAFSGNAGPLKRPVAMVSFALNHYFSGTLKDTSNFKITNILIHSINALLLFWVMVLTFKAGQIKRLPIKMDKSSRANQRSINLPFLLAGLVAFCWAIHPINLTSVLYIVQRMTSLSGLFTLASLICYLKIRLGAPQRQLKTILLLLLLVIFFSFGLLSKENTIILPLFILGYEATLFHGHYPWNHFSRLPRHTQRTIKILAFITLLTLTLMIVITFHPDYEKRSFTMTERLLTEARVLWFYISLILLPRINELGLFHDDISISVGLFTPWTTITSLIGLITLFTFFLWIRKRNTLVALGILWFFIGHSLESTIIPLEITHEHRNYIPSIGIIIACISGAFALTQTHITKKKLSILIVTIAMFFGTITALRAHQWRSYLSLAIYEANHHPNSAATMALLSNAAFKSGDYTTAEKAILHAAEFQPNEVSYLINHQVLLSILGRQLNEVENQKILHLLRTRPISPSAQIALENLANCIDGQCSSLQHMYKDWLQAAINNSHSQNIRSIYYYYLGKTLKAQNKTLDAINAFHNSYKDDQIYLQPLFGMINIFIETNQIDNARLVLEWIEEANRNNPLPQNEAIEDARKAINNMTRAQINEDSTL